MRNTLKFLLALVVSLLAMMAFRALVATVYTVDGEGLAPSFVKGDRVLVNRWSYGLRTGSNGGLFSYGRLCRRLPEVGDFIAYEDPRDSTQQTVLFGRCRALPGDTVLYEGRPTTVPSLKDCADADYYWVSALGEGNPTDSRQLGFISERFIIGRAVLIVYNHDDARPFWNGWRHDRLLLPQ
ncbi:MAG: hypothetical protein IJ612_02745 [Prevotella sp.]|nr:hypothetical protein [Prevotella sp.]